MTVRQGDIEEIMGKAIGNAEHFIDTATQIMIGFGLFDSDGSTALVYSDAKTEKIKLWLSAHCATTAHPDKTQERVGDAERTYAPVGGGTLAMMNIETELQTTRYGRVVLLLDNLRKFRQADRKPIVFKATGPEHPDID